MFPPNIYILETSSLNSYTNGIWDMAFGRQLTLVKSWVCKLHGGIIWDMEHTCFILVDTGFLHIAM